MINPSIPNSTDKTGAIAGLASIICYFGVAVLPLPQSIGNLLGFAFGSLKVVSYIGIYSLWSKKHDGALLRISYVFGILLFLFGCHSLYLKNRERTFANKLL